MSHKWTSMQVGPRITELSKSTLPAGAAEDIGAYPFFCSSPFVKRINKWIFDGDAILMGTGGIATLHFGQGRLAYSTDTWAFTVNEKSTHIGFLFRQLEHALPKIDYFGFEGSGLKHLQKGFVRNLQFISPPPDQQLVVIHVLNTLDTAIHQTKAIIEKLKQVKQGLLHDLLTRGVDSNSEMRPSYEKAPELYQESPLGWIPKGWEVSSISDLLADVVPAMRSGPFGSALLKQELVEAGFPFLGIDNVHTERFVADYHRFVTRKKFGELAQYAVRPADLMITIMGTVGRCCLVPENIGPALSSKHTWTITLDQDLYSPYLAMLQINYSPWVLQHFSRDQQGGTMAAIRSETLRSTLLPVPPRKEQKMIERSLREISRRIELEEVAVTKIKKEKTGLMEDLITGRICVSQLLAQ